jgi:LPXTG-motif cell wall-anchored protein
MLLEDLPMMQTALANAPHTGDHMALWLSLSVLSGLGLAVMTISRKKIYG